MEKQIYIDDPIAFDSLWSRATDGMRTLQQHASHELVYFDSAIVTTRHFYRFVRELLRFTDTATDSFAFVGLRPDPFGYFFSHFSKFPAIVFQPEDDEMNYCTKLQTDPGGSPADALAFNTWAYVVMPQAGGWIAYGDDSKETAAFASSHEATAFARATLTRDLVHVAPGFKLID